MINEKQLPLVELGAYIDRGKVIKSDRAEFYSTANFLDFVSEYGNKTPFRWQFTPSRQHGITVESGKDFFFENLASSLKDNPVSWDMKAILANSDDDIDNAAIPWTGEHRTITAAKLVIDSISSEADGQCDKINFDPLVLAKGISPSEDPILKARSPVYAVELGRRLSEKAKM
ncbi:hypothetical protein [Grimontia sp. NTOU-MAR1]|uniref:hypothetical protein n=1 Tax=Grimontia sp. NTOU-MAR1 TaxID=3111011 RepID=UPI002DBD56E1|nr:hypothetical protein [Grimontia sp. NTOU-MAR1]WRV98689.1 hypothetical protein VP504_04430 [Grimontia sp. NTOU-MAR1]